MQTEKNKQEKESETSDRTEASYQFEGEGERERQRKENVEKIETTDNLQFICIVCLLDQLSSTCPIHLPVLICNEDTLLRVKKASKT